MNDTIKALVVIALVIVIFAAVGIMCYASISACKSQGFSTYICLFQQDKIRYTAPAR